MLRIYTIVFIFFNLFNFFIFINFWEFCFFATSNPLNISIMNFKKLFFVSAIALSSTLVFAQEPGSSFSRIYGGPAFM